MEKKREQKLERMIEDLTFSVAKGFEKVEGDIISLKSDMVWVKDILEKQSGTLLRLDQERVFSLNYIQRLEKEVEKIKKQLKIA